MDIFEGLIYCNKKVSSQRLSSPAQVFFWTEWRVGTVPNMKGQGHRWAPMAKKTSIGSIPIID
jgi:hypothetical protein